MEFKINLGHFAFEQFEVEKNSINLIVGKNNIGKTNLLKEIENDINKNKKKIGVYFLDLNLSPFDALKEPSDFSKNKESMNPNSYFLIKEEFEKDFNQKEISNEILNVISKKMEFEKNKIKFEEKLGFNKLGLSLEINESQISTLLKKPLTIKGISYFNNKIHDITDVGLGHLRIIMLKMLNLVLENNKEKEIILLVDEPEAFLHPNLIKEACFMLKELIQKHKNITVILTTHSPYVMSELKEYFINARTLYIKNEKKVGISSKLNKEFVVSTFKKNYSAYYEKDTFESNDKIISKIISMINFDFSRMFFSDKIIAVEGMSDYFVYTFPKIFLKLKEKIDDFEVIPFHGLSNLSLAYTIFEIFEKNFLFICDNDAKVDSKKEYWTKRLINLKKINNDRIEILESGELENELNILTNCHDKDNNEKPANIIDKKEEIDKNENAEILLKYLNKLNNTKSILEINNKDNFNNLASQNTDILVDN